MKYFNVAADFKRETIDGYYRLNNAYEDSRVLETYGQITIGNICEGGRAYEDIPKIDIEALERYITYSKSKGIDFNYSLNGSCMDNKEFTRKGAAQIRNMLRQLYDAGVKGLTVALPSLIELIKSTNYPFEIKASIICQINNVNKALAFKKAGADRIVVDESLNRDFQALRRIREAFGEKVEIIVNSMCHRDCTYRMFHYNQAAHDSVDRMGESISTYYNHRCMLKRAEGVENFLKLCWVRPEDLKYYTQAGISYYKIQGRHTAVKGDPVRAMECYFRQGYDGNLIDLMELFGSPYAFKINLDNKRLEGYIEPFYKSSGFCRRDCSICGYCESFAKKCTDYESAREINAMAKKYYKDCDEYSNLLKELQNEDYKNANKEADGGFQTKQNKISFDFDLS